MTTTEAPNFAGKKEYFSSYGEAADWRLVPEHLQGGLRRYVELGIPPGHFLQAVLRNDLRDAVNRADLTSLAGLSDIVKFLHCYAPSGSHGHQTAYGDWISHGGWRGMP